MSALVDLWHTFLDALLGPKCGCGERVFPNDREWHGWVDHAGPGEWPEVAG